MAEDAELVILAEVVRKLHLVPDRFRVYECSLEVCRRELGLTDEDFERVIRLKTPRIQTVEGVIFDWRDMSNIASALRRNVTQRRMMGRWVSFAKRAQGQTLEARVEVLELQSDRAGQAADVLAPDGATYRVEGRPLREAWMWARPVKPQIVPSAALLTLLESVQDVELFQIPWEICEEPWAFEEARIADCRSASFHIAQLAVRTGFEARAGWGFIVCAPYSTPHAWVEFNIDGHWVPIDVHMASALVRWGVTPEEDVMSLALTLGTLYWRWSERPTVFAYTEGEDIPLSFPTSATLSPGMSNGVDR